MKPPSILTLLLSLLTLISTSTSTSTPPNDAISLLSFKSTADPNNKLKSYSINNTSSFCTWPGVQCNKDNNNNNNKVIRLVLDNFNLSGFFSDKTLTQLDQLRVLSLRNNSLTGPIPDLKRLINLKALFLDHNNFTGLIPSSIASLHRLRTLDLSYNKLSGVIPVGLSKLDRLNYLRLDSNRLNGSIPPLNQSSLEIFNVSVNFLNGPVPVTNTLSRFGPDLFSVNPSLCGEIVRTKCRTEKPFISNNSTKQEALRRTEGSRFSIKHKRIGLVIGMLAAFLVAFMSVLCVIMSIKTVKRKRRKAGGATREMMELAEAADAAAEVMRIEQANELEKKVNKLHQGIAAKKSGNLVFCGAGELGLFTVEQLMRGSAELLGSGTIGTTYKTLVDGRVVVCVKRLDGSRLRGVRNEVFERHMEVLGGVRHPNVVNLGAYFQTEEEKLLVYDYQPNGSLFSLVHGLKSTMAKPLHWTSCLKIAEDVAQGLSYLHETCNLVHGNLKSSNVLLGSDFEARVSDYCLSALFNHVPNINNEDCAAYKAPEREKFDEPTAKSDVYSFGVVLLELLTGKSGSDHPDLMAGDVVRWVKTSREKGGEVKMEDKRLEMMTEVAVACRARSPERRPTMWEVIKMLQEIKEVAVMEDCGLES